ncbi:hypothetical protein LWI28_017403 [Acer negundo]|uniref:Uncharacterized protein n=1 Tax=Acer negundo TaxID=4023 RepID=A0AAD5J9S9_ACENE|nr:hypothetical protein LWI28_017403 [Acer negundo]KAK4853749.1 hypothetical protein QYF36_013948 [Acer negundo]
MEDFYTGSEDEDGEVPSGSGTVKGQFDTARRGSGLTPPYTFYFQLLVLSPRVQGFSFSANTSNSLTKELKLN